MVRGLLATVGLAVVLAAVGSASGGGTAWPTPDARDRALLASILHGMRTDLRTVRLTQLSADWRKGAHPGTIELLTTTSASRRTHIRSVRADWETLLIAHAYDEQCVRTADHCLAAFLGPGMGSLAGRSGARRPYWSAHVLTQKIRHAFAVAGLPVSSITFERPNALAPIITVRKLHPRRRAFDAERKAYDAVLPALRHTEGTFVQMFDAHGRVFFVSAGSGNTGTGWCARWLHCSTP